MVLNMVLEQAMEDGLITKNPLKSRSIRINGRSSKAIVPYSIDEMQFIVANLDQVKNSVDRMYVALHALHPFRLEEVMGLQWKDIDLEQRVIHIERVVTHPDHNQPVVKDTKTECSHRTLAIVPQIIRYLTPGQPNDFVFGGDKPFSYTVIRRMCNRIAKDIGFEGKITPQRFRTTVLTDLYDSTKDIKQAQAAAGHTTAAMTLKHYVKGRTANHDTAAAIATAYGLT